MNHLKCTNCHNITHESRMDSWSEYDPYARRTIGYLLCPVCEDRTACFDIVHKCDECEQLGKLVDGTDMCQPCFVAVTDLENEITALEILLESAYA